VDFRLSPEEEAFRKEVSDWLDANVPADFDPERFEFGMTADERLDWQLAWHRTLHAGGWVGLHWPREYGGRGASLMEQVIFREELARRRLPPGANMLGILLVGPTLMHWGTDAQKRRYLPKILSAEEIWCQGYSEPGAGSDLASLQTRAIEDGDVFVVNGQKVWTSGAARADWCILLARTEPNAPRHQGISYLLVDMRTPGITVRPLVQMTGNAGFNEVFFEDVRVPGDLLVGEENKGWSYAKFLLGNERVGVAPVGATKRALATVKRHAEETGKLDDPLLAAQIVGLENELLALELTALMDAANRSAASGATTPVVAVAGAALVADRACGRRHRAVVEAVATDLDRHRLARLRLGRRGRGIGIASAAAHGNGRPRTRRAGARRQPAGTGQQEHAFPVRGR